ncbi:hypothetical protein AHiyo8_43680 [Arthrobacter sp. Hiyo8]|nr:hypothetical protein AHiyo8_43680 [Arthrobacter sp. Hiyo8]
MRCVAFADHDGGADFLPLADKAVVVFGAVCLDAVPGVGLGFPTAARDPLKARGEVFAQAQEEGFGEPMPSRAKA